MVKLGQLMQIDGGQMNVYTSGKGTNTIIFLSGGLTSSPVLDFKTLYSYLQNDFKIVVVEKFGYGFSSDSYVSRDVDTMLEETRQILKKKNITSPYILAPHSMSGIEALWWIKKYPHEIKALIGLDMANYEAYSNLKINLVGIKLCRLVVKTGITKFFQKLIDSDAVKFGTLSCEEKEIFRDMFYKNFVSTAVLNEVKTVKRNAEKVREVDLKTLPLLIFSSNGRGTRIKKKDWFNIQKRISDSSKIGEIIYLDCPHYLHNHKAEDIASKIISSEF
jgi:pimeloyl-ACP methyl ester carboxylesterase